MKMKKLTTLALIGVMTLSSAMNVFAFGTVLDESAQGTWSDTNNLTWTYWGGESIVIGAGPKFSDIHPEITDPEYFLKEDMIYPGEDRMTFNSQGKLKAEYTEGTLPLLQEFVNSFDWIHSDEITRLKAVHERIARGKNGNQDQFADGVLGASFNVLQNKKGACMNYAWEFEKLCHYVGLECVNYDSDYNHVSNMVKINGQWIAVDPYMELGLFNNSFTLPVDFEAEKNRHTEKVKNSEGYKRVMDEAEAQQKAQAGEISWQEYFMYLSPGMTWEEIKQLYRDNGVDMDEYIALLESSEW